MENLKTCRICSVRKSKTDFYSGSLLCKPCHYQACKTWKKNNPEKIKLSAAKSRLKSDKEYVKEQHRLWQINRSDEVKERARKRYIEWYKNNKSYYTKRMHEKMKDPKFRIDCRIRTSIWESLKKKKSRNSWTVIVGYGLDELCYHLEKQFDENMNWNNYGSYWHIDHIKPRSLFDISHIKECWALDNLRPLEAKENLRKKNKFYE